MLYQVIFWLLTTLFIVASFLLRRPFRKIFSNKFSVMFIGFVMITYIIYVRMNTSISSFKELIKLKPEEVESQFEMKWTKFIVHIFPSDLCPLIYFLACIYMLVPKFNKNQTYYNAIGIWMILGALLTILTTEWNAKSFIGFWTQNSNLSHIPQLWLGIVMISIAPWNGAKDFFRSKKIIVGCIVWTTIFAWIARLKNSTTGIMPYDLIDGPYKFPREILQFGTSEWEIVMARIIMWFIFVIMADILLLIAQIIQYNSFKYDKKYNRGTSNGPLWNKINKTKMYTTFSNLWKNTKGLWKNIREEIYKD